VGARRRVDFDDAVEGVAVGEGLLAGQDGHAENPQMECHQCEGGAVGRVVFGMVAIIPPADNRWAMLADGRRGNKPRLLLSTRPRGTNLARPAFKRIGGDHALAT
jgi:hypothetical protein